MRIAKRSLTWIGLSAGNFFVFCFLILLSELKTNMAESSEKKKPSKENITRSCNNKRAKRRRHRRGLNKMSTNEPVQPAFGDASHCGWFWQNYYNALEWSERHQIAYWRSRSVALEYENILLHQYVQNILNNDSRVTWNNRASTAIRKQKHCYRQKCQPQKQEVESDEDEKFEFQVNEEMMEFFEKSIRHKMEREKQKEKERKESAAEDEFADLPKQIGIERLEDMQRIYGKSAPMIIGMEAAMQLTFNRNCDIHQPKLWPNIPLHL